MDWLNRWPVRLVGILGLVWTILYTASIVQGMRDGPRRSDFMNLYAASVVYQESGAEQVFEPTRITETIRREVWPEIEGSWPFLNPPPALLVLWPLAFLGYEAAQGAWFGLHLLVYALACGAILRRPASLPLILGFTGVTVNLSFGQNGLLTAGLLGAGCLLLDRRPALAGALMAGVAFKPHLALLIPVALLAGGERRALGGFLAAGAAWYLASFPIFGPGAWEAWLDLVFGHVQHYRSSSVPLPIVTSIYSSLRILGLGGTAALISQALVSTASLAALVIVWRRDRRIEPRATALVLATLLASPKVVVYDLAALAPALAFWLRARGDEPPPATERLLLALGWLLPVLAVPMASRLALPLAPVVLAAWLARVEAFSRRTAPPALAPGAGVTPAGT